MPFPSPGDLLDPGTEPVSPAFEVDSLLSHWGSPYTVVKVNRRLQQSNSNINRTTKDSFLRDEDHHIIRKFPPAMCVYVPSHFSRVQLCVTPWTLACQVPLSMGFCRQEYWSRLLCHPPGDLPDPGIEPASLRSICIGRWVLYH